MDLFENLQIMNESASTYESEVDYSILKQNDVDFYENGAGEYKVVTPDGDKLDINIEVQTDFGGMKYFVSLPSENVKTVDSDLTCAILTVVNKLSGPPFKESIDNDSDVLKESTNDDFVKQECEKYGFNKPSYGSGYMELYLEPTDEAATKFTDKIEADGYKLIDTQKDGVEGDVSENDVTLVYGKEVGENRCIIAVIIHPSEDYTVATCGYNEDESDNEFFESAILKDDKDIEKVVETSILKDEKDMEQIVENKETLTEADADPKEALQNKAIKFGAMIDALAEEMSAFSINTFLRELTNELNMDIYEDGEPYPTDLDGYFSEPVASLNLNDEADAELFDWVDNVLTDCINKTTEFIKGKIETLKGEISALETTISDLESLI